MFANTNELLWSSFKGGLEPVTKIIPVGRPQTQIKRRSDSSFWFGDRRGDNTVIAQMSFTKDGTHIAKTIEEFMGIYEHCSIGVRHSLLVNRDGDVLNYDLLSRETSMQEGQHPNTFHPIQIHPIDQLFVTCGGSIKHEGNHQPVIKVWQPTETELTMKGKFLTWHSNSIQASIILGRSAITTLSTDKTIRTFDLATQQPTSLIPTKVDYYAAAAVDWHSALLGGIINRIDLIDSRTKRTIKGREYCKEAVQVTTICRVNGNEYLFADVNHIYSIDVRTMAAKKLTQTQGERITCMSVISAEYMIIGDSERTLQVWKAF